MSRSAKILLRGLAAGFAGATVLAVWFLVLDAIAGRPFYTPAFVANAVADVDGLDRSIGLIAMYTALHYAAFFAVGVAVAWLFDRIDTAPSLLLGLVLGFLLFDLVFYCSVLVTGVDVVRELGWVEVLSGNLLAGMTVTGVLHLMAERPAVTWWEALLRHRVLREGIVAGLIGAAAVALWFLVFDLVRGQFLFTPGVLGSAVFLQVSSLDAVQVNALTVVGYTAVHALAFILTGIVAAAIVVQAEEMPPILLGALLLFAAFEAFFLGLLAILAQWLLGALAWWTIAVGNLIATAAMATYLWKMHPKLHSAFRSELMEEPPQARVPR